MAGLAGLARLIKTVPTYEPVGPAETYDISLTSLVYLWYTHKNIYEGDVSVKGG